MLRMATSWSLVRVYFGVVVSLLFLHGEGYAITNPGAVLEQLIRNLQSKAYPQVQFPIHGSSLPAAVASYLGIYLLRPPDAPPSGLSSNQSAWLDSSRAKKIGWQRFDRPRSAAGGVAQQVANMGYLALAVAPPTCSKGAASVAVVVPNNRLTASEISKLGPMVALGTKKGTAKQLLASCFALGGVRYYVYKRPVKAQLPASFTRVWLNKVYPDAEYLFSTSRGGKGDGVVIYYAGKAPNYFFRYLFMSFGVSTDGMAITGWYAPFWPRRAPPSTVSPYLPYTFQYSQPANYSFTPANGSLNYFKYLQRPQIMAPKPGTGGCATCGFWFCQDSTQAFGFYVASAGAKAISGRLLAFAGTPLMAGQPLIDQVADPKLKPSPYADGDAVPFVFEGASGDRGRTYAGQVVWKPQWGPVVSQKGETVVSFAKGGTTMVLNYQGRVVGFVKGGSHQAGLPQLL